MPGRRRWQLSAEFIVSRYSCIGIEIYLGRVCKDLRSLVLGEGFLEAGLAVDLLIGALVDVVVVLEGLGTLVAAEALGMPGAELGQLPLHLKGFTLGGNKDRWKRR